MKKVTLKNDFHNTEVNVIPKNGWLSRAQVLRVEQTLCGVSDCCCGVVRGLQDVYVEEQQDGTWRLIED